MLFSQRLARATARGLVVLYILGISSPAWANPEGGAVVGGAASISNAPGLTHIQQSTDRAIINWRSFSNTAGETVRFSQPSATSATLNRVTGENASVINGAIQANGNVYLINPSGVLFGKTATVNVNGLVASSLDIKDEHFMSGRNEFRAVAGKPAAAVVNQGRITTQRGGHVALIGGVVDNQGTITAPGGKVALAAGQEVTLALDQQGLVSVGKVTSPRDVHADSEAVSELVEQAVNTTGIGSAGTVSRSGGRVFLGGAEGLVVNQGVIDVNAASAGTNAGQVRIDSSKATVLGASGTITANGVGGSSSGGDVRAFSHGRTAFIRGGRIEAKGGCTGNGGFVEVSGARSVYFDGSVSTSAPGGRPGTVLIDPDFIIIKNGGAPQGVDNTELALNGGATDGLANDDSTVAGGDGSGTFNISEQRLEQLAADGNDIQLVANCSITIENLTDNSIDLSTGTGGSISLTATSGTISFNDAVDEIRVGGSETITLTAGGNITLGRLVANAGAITVTSTGGSVTLQNVGGTGINTTAGAISVTANGNITLQSSISNGGSVSLNAQTGAIFDAQSGGVDINAASANLQAGTTIGVGSTDGILETDVNSLTATAGGSIAIRNTLGTTVAGMTSGGCITLENTSSGNIAISGVITASTGTVTLDTAGAITDGNGGGNLCIVANTINLVAGTNIGACGGGGELDISANLFNATSGSGGIFIVTQGSIALGLLSAQSGAADVIFTASGSITDGNDGTPGTLNVVANHFGAAAGTNLGATGVAGMIETNATTFSASSGNSGDGGVFINELDGAGNGLGITFLNTRADGSGAGGDAEFLLGTATTLTVNACVLTVGGCFVSTGTAGGGGTAFTLASSKSISTSGGNVTLNHTGQIQLNGTMSGAGSGDITLQSGGAISMGCASSITGRDVVLTATGNITLDDITAGCARTIEARGNNVSLNGLLVVSGNGAVNILAAGGISACNGGGCDIQTAGTVNLAAGTSVGTGAAIDTAIGSLNALAAAGDVKIAESNNIELGRVTASGNVNVQTKSAGVMRLGTGGTKGLVSGASVTLITANGSILDQSCCVTNVAVQAGGNVTITANGGTLCSAIKVARSGGTASFSSAVTETVDVTLGELLTPFGTVTVYAPGAILDGNGASVNIRADRAALIAGSSVGTCADPVGVQASTSSIILDATAGTNSVFVDSVSVLGVGTVTASSGSVRLRSTSNIEDLTGDPAGADITANTVTLESTGVGATIGQSGNRLDVDAGSLIASATGLNTNVHINDISTGGSKTLSSITVDMNQDNGVRLQILRDCGPTLLSAGGCTITANTCGIIVDYQNLRACTALTVNGFVSSNYRIRNDGDITIVSATLGAGDATFHSLNGSVTLNSGTNLDINGRGTGHDLAFFAKNNISINSQIFDSSPGGDSFSVSMTRNFCGADVTGSITINSAISTGGSNLIARADQSVTNNAALNALSGDIQLDAGAGIAVNGALNGNVSLSNNGSGTITQTAPMTGGVLRVNGDTAATLTNAGNNMGLMTTIRSAPLTYSNGANALTLGDGTFGVHSSAGDISITAGAITVAAIAAGPGVESTTGNVALTSTSGNLTGNATLDVKAASLDLVSAGIISNFDTQISAPGTIKGRANGSGSSVLNDVNVAAMKMHVGNTSQNFTLGRNGGPRLVLSGGTLSTTGGCLPSDVAFQADAGALTVNGIAMSGKDLGLTVSNNITQGAGNMVVADLLLRTLVEGNSVSLTNASNSFSTLAADAKGGLTLVSTAPVTIGSLTAATECTPVNGVTTTDDTVTLTAGGNITVTGNVNAGCGSVVICSTGSISGCGTLAGNIVNLDAQGAITAQTIADLIVDADVTVAGNIVITNSGGAVSTSPSTACGSISFTNNAALTLNGASASGAGADITIATSSGGITSCFAITATDQLVLASAGAITLAGTATAAAIDLDAGGAISATVNSTTVDADTSAAGAISLTKSAGGAITFTSVSSSDGGVSLSSTGALTIGTSVTAGGTGNVSLNSSAGVVLTGAVNAVSDTATISAGGAISGGGTITAANVDLDAGGAITANTIASSVDADTTSAGAITVANTGAAVQFTTVSSNNGAVTLSNNGQLTIGTSVTAGGTANLNLTTTGANSIVLTGSVNAAGDTATINSGGAISGAGAITATTVDLDAAGAISANTVASCIDADSSGTGNISVANTGGFVQFLSVSTANGDIALSNTANTVIAAATALGTGAFTATTTSGGNLNVGGLVGAAGDVTMCAAGAFSISAPGGISTATTISLTSGGAVCVAGNTISDQLFVNSGGAITAGGEFRANCIELDAAGPITANLEAVFAGAETSAAGAISLTQIGTPLVFTTVTSFDGAISLLTSGALGVLTSVTAGGANDVSITSSGNNIQLCGTVTAAGDAVSISAGGTIAGTGAITASTVDLDAAGAITANTIASSVDADTTGAGVITISNTGGAVTFTTVTAANGGVCLSSDGLLTVGTAVAANGAGCLALTSSGGIVLTGNVCAAGNVASINAGGAISGAGTITAATLGLGAVGSITANTNASVVNASTSAAGAITLANSGGAVQFGTVTSNDGAVSLSNAGNLTVGTSATANGTARNLTVSTSAGGNVVLTGGLSASGDTVTVNSAGTISGAGVITATAVDLDAVAGLTANTIAATVDAATSGAGAIAVANGGGGAVTFTDVSTSNGSVTLSNNAQLTVGTAVAAGGTGNVNLSTSAGNIVLSGNVSAVGDTATISSAGTISGAGTITAASVDLDAAGGITANTAASTVDADASAAGAVTVANSGAAATFTSVSSSNGAVTLSNNAQLTIGTSVTAGGTANVNLSTSAGNIVLSGGVNAACDTATISSAGTISGAGAITATTADLDAAGSITANTVAASVDADAGAAGAVTIANTGGAVTFTSVSSTNGVVTLSNNGQITIGSSVLAGGASNLSLTATGGNVVLTGNVDAAGDTATINSGGTISGVGTITAASVDLDAAGAITASTVATTVDADASAGGAVTVTNSGGPATFTSVSSTNGAVTLTNDAQLTIGTSVTAGGTGNVNVSTSAGNVVLSGGVNAACDTASIASAGTISGAGTVTATTVDLDAAGSITANTIAASVDADASAAGAVTIANTGGAVTFTSVSASDGAVTLTNAGQLTIGTSVTAGGTNNLSLTASGANLVLTGAVNAAGDTATLNAGSAISGGGAITAASVDLDAAGAIAANTVAATVDADASAAGAVTVTNTGGAATFTSVSSSNGAITLTNDGQLTIGTSVTAGGASNIALTSTGAGVVLSGGVLAAGDTVTIGANGSITGAGAITATTVDLDAAGAIGASTIAQNVDADTTAAGAISITNTGGAVTFTSVTSSNGAVTLSNAGQLTIGTSVAAGGASNLNLSTSAGNVVISGSVDAAGDTATIAAAGAISGAGAITATSVDLDAAGSIAANTVAASVDADASSAGTVTIANTGGAVTFTTVSSTNGAVTLSNNGQLTIGTSVTAGGASNLALSTIGGNVVLTGTVDAAGDAATINSGGAISGAGAITAATVDLDAAGAISVNTIASTVDADATAAGAVAVANAGGAVTFTSVSSTNGAVTLSNSAQLMIGSSVSAGGVGNLNLSTSAGGIVLGGGVDAAGDTVAINSAETITGAGLITATTVDLDAAGAISANTIAATVDADATAAGSIELTNSGGAPVNFASVTSSSGNVRLQSNGATRVGSTVAAGSGVLTIANTGGSPLTLDGRLTAGSVSLSTAGNVVDNNTGVDIITPTLQVAAAGGFGLGGDAVETSSDDLTITVSGAGPLLLDNSAHVGRLNRVALSTGNATNLVSAVLNGCGAAISLSGGVLSGSFGDTASAAFTAAAGDVTIGALSASEIPAAGTGVLPAALTDTMLLQAVGGALRDDGIEGTVLSAPRLQLVATGGVGGAGTAALDILANTVFASSSLTPGALTVPIFLRSLAADTTITTFGNVVNVTSTGNLHLSQVVAGSSISLAAAGSILDIATNQGPSLSLAGGSGAAVNLVAGGTIGSAANPLNIQIANASVVVNAAGVDASNTSVVLAGNLGGAEVQFADFPGGLAIVNAVDVTPIRPTPPLAAIVAEVLASASVRVADPAVQTNTAASLPPSISGASATRVFALSSSGPTVEAPVINSSTGAAVPAGGEGKGSGGSGKSDGASDSKSDSGSGSRSPSKSEKSESGDSKSGSKSESKEDSSSTGSGKSSNGKKSDDPDKSDEGKDDSSGSDSRDDQIADSADRRESESDGENGESDRMSDGDDRRENHRGDGHRDGRGKSGKGDRDRDGSRSKSGSRHGIPRVIGKLLAAHRKPSGPALRSSPYGKPGSTPVEAKPAEAPAQPVAPPAPEPRNDVASSDVPAPRAVDRDQGGKMSEPASTPVEEPVASAPPATPDAAPAVDLPTSALTTLDQPGTPVAVEAPTRTGVAPATAPEAVAAAPEGLAGTPVERAEPSELARESKPAPAELPVSEASQTAADVAADAAEPAVKNVEIAAEPLAEASQAVGEAPVRVVKQAERKVERLADRANEKREAAQEERSETGGRGAERLADLAPNRIRAKSAEEVQLERDEASEGAPVRSALPGNARSSDMSGGLVAVSTVANESSNSDDDSGKRKAQRAMAATTSQSKVPDLKPMMSSSAASALGGRTGALARPPGVGMGSGRTGSFGGSIPGTGRTGAR